MKTQKIGVDLGGTKLLILCNEIEEVFSTGISFTPEELISHLQSFILKHGIKPESKRWSHMFEQLKAYL
ncbi:hypothetical protein [Acinetobacter seifertii]|uniref:hypothetical protein n=1 Tax=Acinetobacter seifertii TaxID=1530123 RepID=UPI0032B37E97